jgi:hypothetical protein
MNTTKPALNGFEERLLAELRQVVSDSAVTSPAPEDSVVPARPIRSTPRRRLAFAVTAAILAAGLAVGVPLVGGEKAGSPAYAIDRATDGTITVAINRWDNPDGLERDLEANGIPAEVDLLPTGKVCKEPRFKPADWPDNKILMSETSDTPGVVHLTLKPSDFQPGWTLVITGHPIQEMPGGGTVFYGPAVSVADGPVAYCEPVDRALGRPTR